MTEPPQPPQSGGPNWGEMKGKMTAARGPQLMILAGGLVLLITSFLPWISVCLGGFCASASSWNSGFAAWGGVLFGVAPAVISALKMANVQMKIAREGQLFMILGIVSVALILLRFLTNLSHSGFGLYIGLVAAAAVAYGAFQMNKATA
ncbi:MAG: hypothetical protein ACYDCC_13910 [Actinomycetota bacterium]